ncbi:hypothetical protein QA645_36475 [Bradyrhizobium sp. CIAT3101]|uniref:hypothetical protein n=1 Tax=Bradyrhizobium sp. CIAT3101 TaxID=439387 RepID=UPI0024B15E77|nr:hypothetical protein [Bradyrhizobium sp. CIAT3101]WFU79939.1 hypothetical protein QA645_36475 [Bradyrhizobium sp. CIAT3101]
MAITSVSAPDGMLPVAEVTERLAHLSDADLLRIRRASQYLCYGGARPADELRQEAFRRALDGTRKCRCNLGIVQFLIGAMRSIASSDRKTQSKRPALSVVSRVGEGAALEIRDPRLSPEDLALKQEMTAVIRNAVRLLFEGDVVGQTLVDGLMEGMEGQELRELVGLDEVAFASKRRSVRRRIDRAFPKGWVQ